MKSLGQIAAQERAVERFAEASPEETLALARKLVETMRTVVWDDELWDALAEASVRAEDAGQLRQLVLVDWETLLEQWGVPEAESVAMDLIEAVTRAEEPGEWGEARAYLRELTELLEGDVREPQPEKPGWVRRVRGRAAAGFAALRRLRIGAVTAEGAIEMAGAVAPTLLGAALFGAPMVSVPVVAGMAVGGLAFGLVNGLRAVLGRAEEVPPELVALFDASALGAYANGKARADLDLILPLYDTNGWCPEIGDLLAKLRLWAARIGATLAAAGPLLGAYLHGAGMRAAEEVMVALVEFQRNLRRIADAAVGGDRGLLGDGVDRARDATGRIADLVFRLEGLVAHGSSD